MTDDRYYCIQHRRPVEYLPELDLYSCGSCECTYKREEVLPANLIELSIENLIDQMESGFKVEDERK